MPADSLVEASDLTSHSALISMIVTHSCNQESLIGSEAANPASHSASIESLPQIYSTKTTSLAKSLETPASQSAPVNAYTCLYHKCEQLKYFFFSKLQGYHKNLCTNDKLICNNIKEFSC